MARTEDRQAIQALPPHRADPSLRPSIRPGRPARRADDPRPSDANAVSKLGGNLPSRSWTRRVGRTPAPSRPQARLRACWVSHATVGDSVQPARNARRVWSSMKNSTRRAGRQTVSTAKKSHASTTPAWFRRDVPRRGHRAAAPAGPDGAAGSPEWRSRTRRVPASAVRPGSAGTPSRGSRWPAARPPRGRRPGAQAAPVRDGGRRRPTSAAPARGASAAASSGGSGCATTRSGAASGSARRGGGGRRDGSGPAWRGGEGPGPRDGGRAARRRGPRSGTRGPPSAATGGRPAGRRRATVHVRRTSGRGVRRRACAHNGRVARRPLRPTPPLRGWPDRLSARYGMDRLLTAIPNFSSSPRMRSVPQSGLSSDITAIGSRASAPRGGRPRRGETSSSRTASTLRDASGPPSPADQDQVTAPARAEPTGKDPQQLVAAAQPGPSAGGAGHDRQLVPQEQVLGGQVVAGTQPGADRPEEQHEELEHPRRMHDPGPVPLFALPQVSRQRRWSPGPGRWRDLLHDHYRDTA